MEINSFAILLNELNRIKKYRKITYGRYTEDTETDEFYS